jgi:hypothetical protein
VIGRKRKVPAICTSCPVGAFAAKEPRPSFIPGTPVTDTIVLLTAHLWNLRVQYEVQLRALGAAQQLIDQYLNATARRDREALKQGLQENLRTLGISHVAMSHPIAEVKWRTDVLPESRA